LFISQVKQVQEVNMKSQRFFFSVILFAVLACASQEATARTLPSKGGEETEQPTAQEKSYLPNVGFSFSRSWVQFAKFLCRVRCIREDAGPCIGGDPLPRLYMNGEILFAEFAISVMHVALWNAEHERTPHDGAVVALRVNEENAESDFIDVKKAWFPEARFVPPPPNQANQMIVVDIRGVPVDARQSNPSPSKPSSASARILFGPTFPVTTKGSPEGTIPVFPGITIPFDLSR